MGYLIDLFMEIHPFILTWSIFFGAGFLFFLVQVIANKDAISVRDLAEHFFPFHPLKSLSIRTDIKIYVFRKFTDVLFSMPGFALFGMLCAFINWGLMIVFGMKPHVHESQFSIICCTLAMILAVEFSEYVTHYLEHKIPSLWELHKVHHSADHMTPLTTKREHSLLVFAGGMIGGVIKAIPAGFIMFLFDLKLEETVLLSVVANRMLLLWTLDPLKHSHIPVGLGFFDKVFISPHMHQVHHSKIRDHWDRNFGTNLSVFDWLFGTGYRPRRGEKAEFGIAGYSDASLAKFNTTHGAFVNPIKRSFKRVLNSYPSKKVASTNAIDKKVSSNLSKAP